MDHQKVAELGLVDTMKKVYNKGSQDMVKIAPKLLDVVKEPALRIAVDKLNKVEQGEPAHPPTENRRKALPVKAYQTESVMTGDSNVDAFHQSLLAPTYPVEGEEGIFDILPGILKTGLSIAAPVLGQGLSALAGVFGAEGEMDPTPSEQDLITLSQRSLAGEAALQALMKVHPDVLQEEGFFDDIKSIAQRVGSAVIKTAPSVIKAAIPIVQQLLQPKAGAESTFTITSTYPPGAANFHPLHQHHNTQLAPNAPASAAAFQSVPSGGSQASTSTFGASNMGYQPNTTGFVQSGSQGTAHSQDFCHNCHQPVTAPPRNVRGAPRLRSQKSFGEMLAGTPASVRAF